MYVPRLTKPEKGNPYYNTKGNGGYSNAIKGKPTDKDCDVLSNCVGYAYGRFNEIGGYGRMKYLAPTNAENFIQYKGSLEVGQTPRLGACMVWRKGNTLSGSDGAGHVAIVEKIISDTEVVTSESGWGSTTPFYSKTRKKGSGRWDMGTAYTFLGFIYNPAVSDEGETTVNIELAILKNGAKGEQVKTLQRLLNAMGYKMTSASGKTVYGVDGSFGGATERAVQAFQKANGLDVDGCVGPMTWNKLLKG